MVFVKDVMHRSVVTIGTESNILEAAEKMSSKGISCLVIEEEGIVKGIITRRDILEKVVVEKKEPESITVAEVMSTPVKTIDEGASLIVASGMMNAHRIKQIPILNDDKLVGIVTQTDIVHNINSILKFDRQQS